jgi:hypothetical protein
MSKIRITTYIEEETYNKLKEFSKITRVPLAQYIQEAAADLLKKYNVK